jgi:hypothetical protein
MTSFLCENKLQNCIKKSQETAIALRRFHLATLFSVAIADVLFHDCKNSQKNFKVQFANPRKKISSEKRSNITSTITSACFWSSLEVDHYPKYLPNIIFP